MRPRSAIPWDLAGFRANLRARNPSDFIKQYLKPLLFRWTVGKDRSSKHREFSSSQEFWAHAGEIMLSEIRLKNFRFTDWFPRAPGVYWSREAERVRSFVEAGPTHDDPYLGRYFSPSSKMDLIEEGGIGSIRLRPRKIDDANCWFATALTGLECHQGVPLAIPNGVLNDAGIEWGELVTIEGHVRFLQDAGLGDTAARVHHSRPLIVYVNKITGVKPKKKFGPIIISPVALFERIDSDADNYPYDKAQYTFVQCPAGTDQVIDAAGEWIQKYAEKHSGRVITNFDEQRPILAGAPLSYQNLVAKTYDRTVIKHFSGTINTEKIDQLIQESVVHQHGDTVMENNITVGASAIININSTLNSVTQSVGAAQNLNASQKSELYIRA